MYITMQGALLADVTNLVGAGGVYHGSKIALYFVDMQPNAGNVLSDFGDLSGELFFINIQNVTWQTPFLNDNLQGEVRGALASWVTTYNPPNIITAYGWVELDSTGTTVLRAERFAQPYTFSRANQEFSIIPCLRRGG